MSSHRITEYPELEGTHRDHKSSSWPCTGPELGTSIEMFRLFLLEQGREENGIRLPVLHLPKFLWDDLSSANWVRIWVVTWIILEHKKSNKHTDTVLKAEIALPDAEKYLSPKVNATKECWIPVKVAADGHSGRWLPMVQQLPAWPVFFCRIQAAVQVGLFQQSSFQGLRGGKSLSITYLQLHKLLAPLEKGKVSCTSISVWEETALSCIHKVLPQRSQSSWNGLDWTGPQR